MQCLMSPAMVGLPDDELFRRIKHHRGVYGKWEDTTPGGAAQMPGRYCPPRHQHAFRTLGS
jgi:hypothetical protein